MRSPDGKEYIIEFVAVGNSMKVTALDTATAIEASIVTPTNISKEEMKRLAIQKLHYVMKKKAEKQTADQPQSFDILIDD